MRKRFKVFGIPLTTMVLAIIAFFVLSLYNRYEESNNNLLPTLAVLPTITAGQVADVVDDADVSDATTSEIVDVTLATPVPDLEAAETAAEEVVLVDEPTASPSLPPQPSATATVAPPPVQLVQPLLTQQQVIVLWTSEVAQPNVVNLQVNPTDFTEVRAQVEAQGGTIEVVNEAIGLITVNVPDAAAAEQLSQADFVLAAEPDYFVSVQALATDPLISQQYSLAAMNIPLDLPDDLPSVTVAVIDSGICPHPELAGKVLGGYDFVENDSTPQDEAGHGCAVAGIIAANRDGLGMAGIAPNARLLAYRVLNAQGQGRYSSVASAIVRAADDGAQIINLSLGGANSSQILQDAVDYATSRGVLVIAAAGNNGSSTVLYPAAYPNVVSVGALSPDGTQAIFSNRGKVEAWAPGVNVLSLTLSGEYSTYSGTSFAAPNVAGLAALELAHGRSLELGVVSYSGPSNVQPIVLLPTNTPDSQPTPQSTSSPISHPNPLMNTTVTSPNGQLTATVQRGEGFTITISDNSGSFTRVVAEGGLGTDALNPIWSPDSEQIAYVKLIYESDTLYSVKTQAELWAVRVDGTDHRLLTAEIDPAIGGYESLETVWRADGLIEFDNNQLLKRYTINPSTLVLNEIGVSSVYLPPAEISGQSVLDVPYFNQNEYADALGYCNVTIRTHGCAVTSAAMVLNYYGMDVNPRSLNNWLKSNNGYADGCLIIWSRATAYSSDIRLSFNVYGFDREFVKGHINQGHPVIIYVYRPGVDHFVVINGYDDNDFYILDPNGRATTKLSQWSGRGNIFIYTPVRPGMPKITSPAQGANVMNPVSITVQPGATNDRGVFDFHVQVARDAGFTQMVFDNGNGWSHSTNISIGNLQPGQHFVRVRQGDRAGSASDWTPARSFVVDSPQPIAPANLNILRNGDFAQGVTHWERWGTIDWGVVNGALSLNRTSANGGITQAINYSSTTGMGFEVSFDVENVTGNDSVLVAGLYGLVPWEGDRACRLNVPRHSSRRRYMVLVSAMDWSRLKLEIAITQGQAIIDNITVRHVPALNNTQKVCPGRAPAATAWGSVPTLTNDVRPTINWVANPNAANYLINFWQEGASTTFSRLVPGAATSWRFDMDLSEGRWFVQIQALNINGQAGPWNAARAIVIDTTPPATPERVSPAAGSSVATLTPRFCWRPVRDAALSHYEVTWAEYLSANTTGTCYVLPYPLSVGQQWWSVRACDRAGNCGRWVSATPYQIVTPPNSVPRLVPHGRSTMLTWTPVTYNHVGYQIEVYRHANLAPANLVLTRNAESGASGVTVNLLAGTYWYRVRVQTSSAPVRYTPWSPAEMIIVR